MTELMPAPVRYVRKLYLIRIKNLQFLCDTLIKLLKGIDKCGVIRRNIIFCAVMYLYQPVHIAGDIIKIGIFRSILKEIRREIDILVLINFRHGTPPLLQDGQSPQSRKEEGVSRH